MLQLLAQFAWMQPAPNQNCVQSVCGDLRHKTSAQRGHCIIKEVFGCCVFEEKLFFVKISLKNLKNYYKKLAYTR
jgi:hypothetical protein